jgi:hypothetical protein
VDSHKGFFEPTGLVAAKEIDVATLRLPVRAGQLDTAALLPAQDRRTLLNGARRLLPDEAVEQPLPRSCFMVRAVDESALLRRLIETNMVILLPEAEVARQPNGRLLLNGCFGVDHKKGMRAIFDCRPANAGEKRLRLSCMPCGVMLSWLRVHRKRGHSGVGRRPV